MEFEGWSWVPWAAVLLALFFALGWLAARIDLKQLLSESKALPASYFKGLNFLLNEQQDKAIEAFIEVTKANPETVELQFALGSLFRRRGEMDRAIRVHQELSARADLPAEQRRAAQFELAQDFMKSGLLDHAEGILVELNKVNGDARVHRHLLDIYLQEKDWGKAITVARQLGQSAHRDVQKDIAHYFCELATTEYVHGRRDEAARHMADALEANPRCVRVSLQSGEWAAAEGRHDVAIETWRRIESQNPDYFGLAAPGIRASFKALNRASEGLALLRGLQEKYPSIDFLNVVYQATLEEAGPERAYDLLREDVRKNPTLVGLDMLLSAQIEHAPTDKRGDLQLMKDLVHSHASALSVYLCGSCGFRARQFYWHCPACGSWESFSPKRTAELETAERHLARITIGQIDSRQ
jgi:lipopolysaccharide assembly protein B